MCYTLRSMQTVPSSFPHRILVWSVEFKRPRCAYLLLLHLWAVLRLGNVEEVQRPAVFALNRSHR